MSYDYIPDLTQRFPEGFDGVDMTPSFYGEPVDWSRSIGYEPTYDELLEDEMETENDKEPAKFEIGEKILDYEFDGGYTIYGIIKFNKDRTKVYVTEEWHNYDGWGKRKPHWCKLITEECYDRQREKFQPDDRYDSWVVKGNYQ